MAARAASLILGCAPPGPANRKRVAREAAQIEATGERTTDAMRLIVAQADVVEWALLQGGGTSLSVIKQVLSWRWFWFSIG